jgi:hypothetical protein
MIKEQQKLPNKSLFFTDERFNIWIETVSKNVTAINVTDPDLSLTYHIADFNGTKYEVKNKEIFNYVFIRSAKKRPQLIRDLLKFHNETQKDLDVFDEMKTNMNIFKRKVNIYTKKTINKAKYKLFS